MKTAEALTRDTATRTASPCVEIVVPVHNEEASLADSVRRLRSYLDRSFPFTSVVTVVDNGSTDATSIVAADLVCELEGVRAVRLTGKGRGRALRAIWSTSAARVVAYMDVDLATSLDALLPLVAPLLSGHSDVAIGTRLAPGARVVRGPKRELISRVYNLVLKIVLRNGFSDAQCGFKAARTDVAKRLLPHVEDNEWFFDTEFLVLAERSGYRIHEVPVDWVDDPDSRVDIIRTAGDDLRGLARLCLGGGPDAIDELPSDLAASVASFARIGVVSTLAYLALFFLLAGTLGRFGADALALAVCTAANTAGHGRYTFARRGKPSRRNLFLGSVAVFSTSVTVTFLALGLIDGVGVTSWWLVAGILVLANAAAALVRFVVLRSWTFRTAQTNPRAEVARAAPPRPVQLHERQTA
ncbi:MAG TPA: glycosyltransferase [Acidimicrobiales bacterium]|nr:glycosyltransferase [Acidimicrobiales bacterium]